MCQEEESANNTIKSDCIFVGRVVLSVGMYLCKFNKAAVGVHPLLTRPILIGHDLTEVTDGHEHTFFIVLHRTHEDAGQVLHELNLK